MSLQVPRGLLQRIRGHGQSSYPDEGAGFLLGLNGQERRVHSIVIAENSREAEARRTRYFLEPQDYIRAEQEAESQDLEVMGIFHSHPDHPDHPSEFDREWAQPSFSYVITSVAAGAAKSTRSWRLSDDRSGFVEEAITIVD